MCYFRGVKRLILPVLSFLLSTSVFATDIRGRWSNEFVTSEVNSLNDETPLIFNWGISWRGAEPRNENETRPFSLGSVKKIITAATALRELGSMYQFSNEFTADLDPAQSIIFSPSFSVSGDPTWAHPSYGETLVSRVANIITELKKLNVKKVVGDIQINLLRPAIGQFHRPAEWKDEWLLKCYATLPTPVSLNGNCAELSINSAKKVAWVTPGVSTPIENKLFTDKSNSIVITPQLDALGRIKKYTVSGGVASAITEAVPVHQNEGWLKNIFIQQLKSAGIIYQKNSKQLTRPQHGLSPFYVDLSSKPLKEILIPFLQESINLVGDRLHIEASDDLVTLGTLLSDPTEYQNITLLDGSGLIAADKITPATFLHILTALQSQPYFQDLYAGLPVSGESGTLQNRMNDALLKSRVHAKTGTIDNVANLAGYWTKSDQTLEPFVIFTESNLSAPEARLKVDAVVLDFARKN